MMNFPKDFPKVQTELLSCNYRSTPQILEAAGKVIAGTKEGSGRRFIQRIPRARHRWLKCLKRAGKKNFM